VAVFAGLVVLMGISLTLLMLLRLIERRALAWQDAKGTIKIDETA
jgi:NitT/TauT family transport system permease protein